MGKLYFQNRVTHTSVCGVRGSFLLTSGKVENAVGWDIGCLVEDYEFAWRVSVFLIDLEPEIAIGLLHPTCSHLILMNYFE